MQIRLATEDDAAAVAECVVLAYSPYLQRMDRPPAPMLADHAAAIDRGEVWIAVDKGRVHGVIVLVPEADHLFIANVAVEPAHQGHGLGRSLMTFAEDEAARRGLTELRLYTNELMIENVDIYGRLGFDEVERRTEDGYRWVFMRKTLPASIVAAASAMAVGDEAGDVRPRGEVRGCS